MDFSLYIMLNSNLKSKSFFSYGLNIKSFIHLPDLVITELENNVKIREGSVRKSSFYRDFQEDKIIQRRFGLVVRPTKEAFCLEWDNLGVCLVQNGSNVIIELNSGVQKEEIIPFI